MIYRLTLRGAPFHLFISHFIIPKCSPLCAETEFNVLLCCCHVFCALLYPFIIPRFFFVFPLSRVVVYRNHTIEMSSERTRLRYCNGFSCDGVLCLCTAQKGTKHTKSLVTAFTYISRSKGKFHLEHVSINSVTLWSNKLKPEIEGEQEKRRNFICKCLCI